MKDEEPRIRLFVAGERIDARVSRSGREICDIAPPFIARGARARRAHRRLSLRLVSRRRLSSSARNHPRPRSSADKPKRRPPLRALRERRVLHSRKRGDNSKTVVPFALFQLGKREARKRRREREYRGSGICDRSRFGENNYTGGGCIFHGIVSRERRVRSPRD